MAVRESSGENLIQDPISYTYTFSVSVSRYHLGKNNLLWIHPYLRVTRLQTLYSPGRSLDKLQILFSKLQKKM